MTTIIVYSALFVFMIFIVYLSNREIARSLSRTKESEKLLRSERNALEQRVADRARELAALEEERLRSLEQAARFGTLSQGLVHDLMSPLSSISLHIEGLRDAGGQSTESLEAVNEMIGVSRRMNSFMENLKHYLGKENMIRKSETVDIAKEISIVRDILAYKARMAGTTIVLDVPASLIIQADQIQMHRVISNLMENALEACGPTQNDGQHENTIRVSLRENAGSLRLSVTDTGCGIPGQYLSQVFKKPFTTKEHGTGSGLMTVKYIVEKELGGSISVESAEGTGTTFTITMNTISPSPPSQNDTPHPESSSSRSDTAEHP